MPQAQRITIPIIGQESRSRSFRVDVQQTRNFITGISSPGGKQAVTLDSAPGLVQQGAIGNGPCRSPSFVSWRHPADGTQDTYCVFGTQVVRITKAAGPEVIGTLLTSTGSVRIARGRTHLMFVDGSFGYTYDGITFQQISDLDFPQSTSSPPSSPTHVVYIDGFFVVNDAFTDLFYISAIENPDAWNALDFGAAAVGPDRGLALAATESELWLIGDETSQAFYNSGNALFPFQIILSATQEVGIVAPQTIAESDAGVFFLATTPEGGLFVYRIRGHDGQRISSEEQDEQIAAAPNLESAVGFIYQQEGKSFYVLQLHPDVPTLVFNIRAQAWESRALADGTAWRINGHGVFDGANIGGSRLGPLFYNLDLGAYRDAGTPLIRRRVTQIQHNNNQLLDWWELVLDLDVQGVPASGDGSDPKVRLRYSDDEGETYSSQLIQPMGKQGQRFRRSVFRNMGSSRNRIFEIEVSDPVGVTIVAAYARVAVLTD